MDTWIRSLLSADGAVQPSDKNKHESRESETQTDRPFECHKYCGEICADQPGWNIHMIKHHLDNMNIIWRINSGFLLLNINP